MVPYTILPQFARVYLRRAVAAVRWSQRANAPWRVCVCACLADASCRDAVAVSTSCSLRDVGESWRARPPFVVLFLDFSSSAPHYATLR